MASDGQADATRAHPVRLAAGGSNTGLRGAPKVVLCGEPGVGKTALVRMMLERKFQDEITTTLGVEQVSLVVDNGQQLNVWDIAGQMRASANNTMVYRGAHAFIVAAALDSVDSIEAIRRWLQTIRHYDACKSPTAASDANVPLSEPMPFPTYLVFNKTDLVDLSDESRERYRQFQVAHGCHGHFFTSAKVLDDVRAMFTGVAVDLTERLSLDLQRNRDDAEREEAERNAKQQQNSGGSGCPCGGGGGKQKKQPAVKRRK